MKGNPFANMTNYLIAGIIGLSVLFIGSIWLYTATIVRQDGWYAMTQRITTLTEFRADLDENKKALSGLSERIQAIEKKVRKVVIHK